MDKIIVTSGCSFTLSDGTWPFHINQNKYGWVHNVGDTGAGNSYISRSVIYEVKTDIWKSITSVLPKLEILNIHIS